MAYVDKMKWVYVSLFFLSRKMHIKQTGRDSECWKKESRKITAWRPEEGQVVRSLDFLLPDLSQG
jgi:hypothetical protein